MAPSSDHEELHFWPGASRQVKDDMGDIFSEISAMKRQECT